MKPWLGLAFLGAIVPLATGCVPATRFRNSAVVPSVTPPIRSGRALEHGGRIDLSGQATSVHTSIITLPEDPALLVAENNGGFGGRLRLGDMFDIGVSADSAMYESTTRNTLGAAPVPSHKNAFGVGVQMQGHWAHRSGFGIAAVFEAKRWSIPYAKWECAEPTTPCPGQSILPTGDSAPGYVLDEEGETSQMVTQLALIPSYRTGPATIFLGFSAHGTITNVGFTNAASEDSTVESGTPAPIGFMGVELAFDRFRVAAEIHQVGSNPGNNGLGFGISLGWELGAPVSRPRAAELDPGAGPNPYFPPGSPGGPPPTNPPWNPQPLQPAPITPPPTDPYGGPR